MRYTPLVLSTLAVGQAAAAAHNRHASFHARRQADAKRSADGSVDWSKIAVDLKDVDWDAINWSSVFISPTPTPEAKQPEATPEPQPTQQAQPTQEATINTQSKDVTDAVSDVVSDLLQGVQAVASRLGAKVGANSKSSNGGIWIGNDSPWQAEFTNDNNQEAVLYCWKANGFSGMSINVNTPDISVGLQPGQKVNLSFAKQVPAACAPAFPGTDLAMFGGLAQTWFEVTFGDYGAFDISRNVNMKGNAITAKGSKCTSDMNTCVFKCKDDSVSSCEKGTDYDLFGCGSGSGGGGGYDPVMAGTGGGCAMGASSETIKVILH